MGILKIILNFTVADQKAISRVILAECAINCWHHDSKSLLDSPPSFLPSFLDAAPWLFSLLCHFARLFFWILCSQMCFMLWSPRPWDYSCCSLTPWRVIVAEGVFSCMFPLCCGVSDTFNAVGCARATCLPCLGTKLSPVSTHSFLHGRGWGKRSRMYNVLIRNLYRIWQHYYIDDCQEYDWHDFLGSFSHLRYKFDMYWGKHIFQETFKEKFIPYIAVLQVFTLLNWILAIFTISLCLPWVITYNCANNFWNQTF